MKASYLLGRMIFGGYFLYAGIHHIQESEAMAQYTASKGIPAPELAVKATGIALIAGGTSVLLGLKKEWGAAAIAGFLVGVSPLMHDFWKQEDPQRRQNEMINFGKNMALLGASLALMGMEKPRERLAVDRDPNDSENCWRPTDKCAA
jgi:putative oxidoreductase